jgi:phage gp29-like protein
MIRGEMLPQDKFIVPRHFATYKNPYGLRTLSRCFWPVAFKKGGLKYWMQFMEKFGIPWLVGKVPRGTSKDQRTALLTDLSTMVQSAVAVINDDETIEAMDMGRGTSSRSNNIYAEMANNANGEISKAILTQTLTTEIGDKGAYAASQSHLKVRSELCEMDKELVAGAFNRLFEICCKLNFAGAVTPQFIFVREEDPKEEYARRDTQLSGQGVRFSEEYYARQYNLRVDEFTVVDPTPPPAQAAPGNDKENESVQNKKRVEQRTKTRENPAKSTKPKDKK